MVVDPVAAEASEVATTPGRWQPAIREIVTDHDALGRVYFERDDDMEIELCDAFGLFFLAVETGDIEGWTWPLQVLPSPGNRFVHFPSDATPVVYDRASGRSYTWDPAELSLVVGNSDAWTFWPTDTDALVGWGTGSAERLLFRGGTHYAVVDASMAAVAWFELDEGADPRRWWAHPDGTRLLVLSVTEDSSDASLSVVDLSDGSLATARIPVPDDHGPYPQMRVARSEISLLSRARGSEDVFITRYDWALTELSSVLVPFGGSRTELSPDGTLVSTVKLFRAEPSPHGLGTVNGLSATSIFDVMTGAELVRIKGALPSRDTFAIHYGRSRWLADSSGLVLDARTDTRIVSVDGATVAVFPTDEDWWEGLVIPSRDDRARFDRPFGLAMAHYCPSAERLKTPSGACRVLSARVVNSAGEEAATAYLVLRLVPGAMWLTGEWVGAPAYNRTSWGLTSDELRVHLGPGGPLEGGNVLPLLEPVVDHPPFTRLTALEVDTDQACVELREAPAAEAGSLMCLPAGTVVDSITPPEGATHGDRNYPASYIPTGFAYVRTEDGVEGWLPLGNVRWAE